MAVSNARPAEGPTGGRTLVEFEVRLSGSVEVRAAGRRSDLGPTQTRVVLAALAWDADRFVSVDKLIHRVWDEHPPVKAREALHSHVSRIRRALRTVGGEAPALVSRTNAYILHIDPDRVDLRCYTDLVHQARSLRGSDEPAALRLLDRADRLWRGEPLAGIAGSWPEHLRAAVGETRVTAATTRAEILMGRGGFADAVPVLLPLVEERPVDEAMAELLAVALYGSSRTAEATRLLQRTRQRVVRDIGLDAGRGLRRVHQGILSGTPASDLLRRADRTGPAPVRPVPAARRAPDNLPRDVPWVGRRDELRRLGAVLREDKGDGGVVVTVEAIHGMGGVGKSALAVHLAHGLRDRYPDGRLFVHLGGGGSPDRTASSPVRVLTELLRLLGMDVKDLPRDTDELVALWRSTAQDRRMLVILDDAADSAQVRPLLPGASPTAVVVTSRRRLPGLPGVRALSLDLLPPRDAVALFTQRLGQRHGTDEADLAEIVRLCDHLPLAVEIAASRLLARPSWTTADLLRELRGGVSGGARLAALRDGERSMAHVFAPSYHALNAEQRLVFRRIGLHRGVEFGPAAVAALTGLSVEAAERVLEELMVHQLVAEPTPHRFTMHDLLRGYARSLIDKGETDSAEDIHRAVRDLMAHYMCVADRADRLAYPFRSRIALDADGDGGAPPRTEVADAQSAESWFITESANLLETLTWYAEHAPERRLALAVHVLAGFLDMEGHLATAEPLLRRAVAHWDAEGDRAARARALLDLSAVHTHGSRYEEGVADAREALETARSLGDAELEVRCIHQLSILLWQTGEYTSAQSLQKRSLDLLTRVGDTLQMARSHNLLGITHLHLAENEEAFSSFEKALVQFTMLDDARGRYSTLNNLAKLHQRMGDLAAAEEAFRGAIGVAESTGSKRDQATIRMNLASVLEARGKPDEALALYNAIVPVLREVGDRRAQAIALNGTGRALRVIGRGEEALTWHEEALDVARRVHAVGEEIDFLFDLAQAEQSVGRVELAVSHLEQSLIVSHRVGARAEEDRAARALSELRGELDRFPESGR
ncbi:tetratricopeptide repeat protein [Streptomyces sp. NPDC026672]|uniref:AfsR/SARP family transcriptional regulator n=1 Tax=unclassified Streptomyces TaxID=2593676 RepID=UPI0033DBAFB2